MTSELPSRARMLTASASPTVDVEMQSAVLQPRPHQSEQQSGKEADEDDVEKTEQDSTAEHMDIDPPTTTATSAQPVKAPNATHDTADEQADILAPLPPPSPPSSNTSPLPNTLRPPTEPATHKPHIHAAQDAHLRCWQWALVGC